ncbi:MAG TPA: cupin domain-containing protein [Planctomycetaceae bacterium]|nr:cupin domain-containing protein [Planctomycetaceae bacterium]
MPFIDISAIKSVEAIPGCHLRTPFGENILLSYLEMDPGAVVPLHDHPHEQAGIVLKGKLEMTIDGETRLCTQGDMFIVPPGVPHTAVAIDGPVTVLDIFSPVREDYAKLFLDNNK